MEIKATKIFHLRITGSLRDVLEQLANRSLRSLADEIRRRVTDSHTTADQNLIVDHPEFFNGAKEIISLRLPETLHQELKQQAAQNNSSINAEITKRLLLSDPLGDLNKTTTHYTKPQKKQPRQVKETTTQPDYKGLCPQTEDERIMLEKYRQLTPQQRTQLHAISDTFTQQIENKKAN